MSKIAKEKNGKHTRTVFHKGVISLTLGKERGLGSLTFWILALHQKNKEGWQKREKKNVLRRTRGKGSSMVSN